jgi:thiol-disulfide isomerase/thioredoxin
MFAVLVFLAALGAIPPVADARRQASVPSTGLPKIAFAKPPPDFTFDADGAPTRLSALAGKPVVVNFWATWCAPCEDELATFARLQTAYGDGVKLIVVSNQDSNVTVPFLHAHGVAQVVSVADPEGKIFDLYGVKALPVTLILGRDGTVGHVSIGELDWTELQTAVDAASVPLPALPAPVPTHS